MKDLVDTQLRDQHAEFLKDRSAQTESQHYGSSLNNRLNGIRHYTSTSLTMERSSTMWIGEHYGNAFYTIE
ncbi:hypothetical protein Smp_179550 [Schistosoma mansoni]|uniref:hypothetical protein n=1 Tax=Schistosoma mansoni TaxID=6183 RepID=UPI00022DCBED|nr:hypothetical protein Smp_179550 [Schistosoma mansoni]|eukprot:XP_018655517.1 hypothetical protein Smp_179550 [Schistosoma mansoni]